VYTDPEDYLSEKSPSVVDFDFEPGKIPAPPAAVVKALVRAILQNPQVKSIKLLHAPTYRDSFYPLWFVSFWSLAEDAREAQVLWRRARGMLQEREKKVQMDYNATEYVQAALTALKELPWKEVVQGFRENDEVGYLACWLTTDWLKTTHEHQMLEILTDDLALDESSLDTIQNTFFAFKLSRAFYNPEAYRTAREWRWVRQLGEAFTIGQRRRFGTIANINENHWVAIAFDSGEKAIYYGDSMGGEVPKSIRDQYNWWIYEHLGQEYCWKELPIPQQSDLCSCGILAHFCLAHFFDPEHFPLPVPTLDSMANERLKMFIRAAERHKNAVRASTGNDQDLA
jgi:hypothetical protein